MAQPHARLPALCVLRFSRAVPLLIAIAAFSVARPALAQTDGTWTSPFGGVWEDPSRWQSGQIADGAGATANFDFDINGGGTGIAADVTVSLGASHTVGILNIGDLDGTNKYTIGTNGGFSLVFDSGDVTDVVHAQL